MAKITVDQFIADRLGGAAMYDNEQVRSQITTYLARATGALDVELTGNDLTFADLNEYQEGIYNRVAGDLIWAQLQVPPPMRDEWNATVAEIDQIFEPSVSDYIISADDPPQIAQQQQAQPSQPTVSGLTEEQVDARVVAGTLPEARSGNTDRWDYPKLPADIAKQSDIPSGGGGNGGGLDQDAVDARVVAGTKAPARAGNTSRFAKADLPTDTVYDDDIAGFQTGTQVDTRIDNAVEDYAETGKTDRAPKNRLPSDTVYDADITGFQTQGDVDARVVAGTKAPARAGNTSRFGKSDVPADTVYDADIANFQTQSQVDARVVAGTKPAARTGGGRFAKTDLPTDTAYDADVPSNSDIDARIAAYARAGATVVVPDANLPTILRGLPSAFGTSGQVLQVNSGRTGLEFATPASGGGGGGQRATTQDINWGNVDGSIPNLDVTPPTTISAWSTIHSPTIPAGAHILTYKLAISNRGTSWIGLEYRFQMTRNSVVTTIEDTPRLRYNGRGTADKGDLLNLFVVHFDSIAGDTFELQARAIVDNNQLGTAITYPAADQRIKMTTWA